MFVVASVAKQSRASWSGTGLGQTNVIPFYTSPAKAGVQLGGAP